jgi:uncharacterized protein
LPWLGIAFFFTALFYASVGFGGGSTYSALLTLAKTDYRILPALSLICNVIVVTGGAVRFGRAGHIPWRRVLPLVLASAPLAWLGGLTPIKEVTFQALLAASLGVTGLILLFQRESAEAGGPSLSQTTPRARFANMAVGAAIGYLSGLVGIGGGIFLAPYLHFTKWAESKVIAGTATLFILVNSVTGLAGQLQKTNASGSIDPLFDHWPLVVAVAGGGLIGSHLGVQVISPSLMRRLTALLILYVAVQLAWKLLG